MILQQQLLPLNLILLLSYEGAAAAAAELIFLVSPNVSTVSPNSLLMVFLTTIVAASSTKICPL